MNVASQIERHLPQQMLELVGDISREATQLGQKAYLVGGVVRDLLLGYSNLDLDVVIEGDAVKLAQRIAKIRQLRLVTHPRFGTVKLSDDNFTLDIATARCETYSNPGALPTVIYGTLSGDLFRRDFSINAMAISLVPSNYGELIDPYQGRNDIERRYIRILHPGSFSDDATRILRAIRYEQRLGFELELQTSQMLKQDISMLDTISGDRIRHELELILKEKHPESALGRLGELGALQKINVALRGNGWITEKFSKARLLSKSDQLPSLYLCLFIYSLSQRENGQLIHRLNVPAKLARALRDTLQLKSRLHLLCKTSVKHSEIYYLLREYDPLAVKANAITSESSSTRSNLELFLTKLRYVKTLLNGDSLKKLGFSAGLELGEILQVLHKAKLDGEVKTVEEEKKLALSMKPQHKGKRRKAPKVN